MTGPAFARLLSPLSVGPLVLPSRVLFGPHVTNFTRGGLPGPRHAAYYAERARGGAGLVVTETIFVHPSSHPYERALFAQLPDAAGRWAMVARAVHAAGGRIVASLGHAGAEADGSYSRLEVWGPSPVPDVTAREIPKVMEREDIEAVIGGFAAAAGMAREAEMDGVEVGAGSRSLLRQFLSPLTNWRQDEYGGSPENRLRLLREVLGAVRRAVGAGRIVGLRLAADEHAPWAGIRPEDAAALAAALARDGLVDYVAVEVGGPFTAHLVMAPMSVPQEYAVAAARAVKAALGEVPVAATGSIADPALAEEVLASGLDLVEMTRPLIADPYLVEKVRAGRYAEICPCTLCNQDCRVATAMNPRLGCAVNPSAGLEGEEEPVGLAAPVPRRVVVVGGGPAGMEAARVAALRGHRVCLFERQGRLGGTLALVAGGPGRERWSRLLDWLRRELDRLAVDVRLGREVSADDVLASDPDAVIVATGGRPRPHGLPLGGPPEIPILSPRAVLAGEIPWGEDVLVVDREGGWPAVLAAEVLAAAGRRVEIVTEDMFVSRGLAETGDLVPWYQRAAVRGIRLTPQTVVARVGGGKVTLADRFDPEAVREARFDAIVVADFLAPDEDLYFELRSRGVDVRRAGDCVAPRRVGAAIREGREAGRRV